MEYFEDHTASFADQLMHHPEDRSLKAVRENRVYPIPVEYMYMPGLRTAKGLCLFAKGLYPDIECDMETKGGGSKVISNLE